MDGLGIPILGGLVGFAALLVCLSHPTFRRYALAALVSPTAASVVADMNPAVEYGAQYIPTGREHNPTTLNYCAWLGSTMLTFLVRAGVCFKVQQAGAGILRRIHPAQSPAGKQPPLMKL